MPITGPQIGPAVPVGGGGVAGGGESEAVEHEIHMGRCKRCGKEAELDEGLCSECKWEIEIGMQTAVAQDNKHHFWSHSKE